MHRRRRRRRSEAPAGAGHATCNAISRCRAVACQHHESATSLLARNMTIDRDILPSPSYSNITEPFNMPDLYRARHMKPIVEHLSFTASRSHAVAPTSAFTYAHTTCTLQVRRSHINIIHIDYTQKAHAKMMIWPPRACKASKR